MPSIVRKLTTERVLALIAALAAALLTLHAQWASYLVNRDGIRHLRSADAFIAGDYKLAFTIDDWPFYSFALAMIHRLSGLGTVEISYMLSVLALMTLAYLYVRIVAHFSRSTLALMFAVVIITTLPALNTWRDYIIRGHLFWFLILAGFYSYLLFNASGKRIFLLLWSITVSLAVLLRIEAIALFLVPLCMFDWWRINSEKLKDMFVSYALPLLVAIVFLLFFFSNPELQDKLKLKIYLVDNLLAIPDRLRAFVQATESIGWDVVAYNSRDYLPVAMFAALLVIFVLTIVSVLSIVHSAVLLLWFKEQGFKSVANNNRKLWLVYVGVIVAYLLLFLFMKHFVASRYMLSLALITAICLPLAWEQLWLNGLHVLRISAGLSRKLIVLLFAAVLVHVVLAHHDFQKKHIDRAASWMGQQERALMLTNDAHIAYFSKMEVDWHLLARLAFGPKEGAEDWRNYQWLVLSVKKDKQLEPYIREAVRQNIQVELMEVFVDDDRPDRKVYILRRKAQVQQK